MDSIKQWFQSSFASLTPTATSDVPTTSKSSTASDGQASGSSTMRRNPKRRGTASSLSGLDKDGHKLSQFNLSAIEVIPDIDQEVVTFPMSSNEIQQRMALYQAEIRREEQIQNSLKQMERLYSVEEDRRTIASHKQQKPRKLRRAVQSHEHLVSPTDFVSVRLAEPAQPIRRSQSLRSVAPTSLHSSVHSGGAMSRVSLNRPITVTDEIRDKIYVSERRMAVFRQLVQRLRTHAASLFPTGVQSQAEVRALNERLMKRIVRKDMNEEYELLQRIGRGQFGEVFKAKQRSTGVVVAIKQCKMTLQSAEGYLHELDMMRHVISPYCIRYHACFFTAPTETLSIVMEYCEYDSIGSYILMHKMTQVEIASVCQQVLRGLAFLHGMRIVHQDVKATNILLCKRGRIKLGDFGLARALNEHIESSAHRAVGSPYWMAPEVIQWQDEAVSDKCDVWSLGITLIEMAETFPPYFQSDQPASAMYKIANGEVPTLRDDSLWSDDFKTFLGRCLVKDVQARASASELLALPFVTNVPRPFEALYNIISIITAASASVKHNEKPR